MRVAPHSFRHAFTLVELIATIAILAAIITISIPFIADYVTQSRQTADRQTLQVLNDAINRYKTQGGNLSALTEGKHYSHLIAVLQTPVAWNGVSHQFLLGSSNIPTPSTVSATGSGHTYRLTAFNSYQSEPGGSEVGTGQYFLLSEDAEGTGTPAGWTDNTGINATRDWDYTTSAIEGNQSLRAYSTNSGSSSIGGSTWTGPFPADGTVFWIYCQANIIALPVSPRTSSIISLQRASDSNNQFSVNATYSGYLSLVRGDGATIDSLDASAYTNSLHIWIRKNADGTADIWISSTSTRPGSPTYTAPVWNSGQLGGIRFGISWGGDALFDHIRVSETEIGSNPE